MIYTFYSFKGGVGRSMAMANVAEWFYQQGLRVIVIDWDLEAPGLENFFYSTEHELDIVRSQLGLIDMLLAYKRIFPRLRLPEAEEAGPPVGEAARPKWVDVLREVLPPISDALYPIHAPETTDGKGAALWLLPAGWRSGDRFPIYAQAVQGFNWTEFYNSFEGESYFNWMREQLLGDALADVVLIDSRTGVTEMGGVCTRQMADAVVSFCVPNAQNLGGVQTMAKSFARHEIIEKRERGLDIVLVPTRIDMNELNDREAFGVKFRQRLDEFTPSALQAVKANFWDLQIPYIPKYAYSEKLAINELIAPELSNAYKKLAAHLALLAQGRSGLQIRAVFAGELQREFGDRLPSVFISSFGAEGDVIAGELRERLAQQHVALWPALSDVKGAGDDWQKLTGILDQAKAMVLIMTPEAMHSELVRRQWRYARQQGVNIYLVAKNANAFEAASRPVVSNAASAEVGSGTTPNAHDAAVLPHWLRTDNYYDADGEWESLAGVLQRPVPTTRVPFMAPDLPEGYVERPELLRELKDALLGGARENSEAAVTVALCGPGGCGKTIAAIGICQDEEVNAYFEDGMMWVTLGDNPNVLAELTKLYAALTGERPPFVDEGEAAKAVSAKLSGKRCLLVISDAQSIEHLRFFTPLGDSRCARLITTRDLNIAFATNARLVRVGMMSDPEALRLIGAQLDAGREEQTTLIDLARQLENWPLALRLANAELKKRAKLGHDLHAALKSLTEDSDKNGALALDGAGAEGKGAISQKLESAIERALLSKEEHERYFQLAFFPHHAEVTLKDVSELWGLDEGETEKRIQHLRDVSLLDYDPTGKIVRLQSVMRSYILSRMPDQDGLNDKLEAAFTHFSPVRQEAARRVLTRLVRLTTQDEDGDDTRQRFKVGDLDASSQMVVESLSEARLVVLEPDQSTGATTVQIANEAYLKGWKRLRGWIKEDREFLLWRQQLRLKIAEWEETGRDHGALLTGVPLEVASRWREQRPDDLNAAEQGYIDESVIASARAKQAQQAALKSQNRTRIWTAAAILITLGIVAGLGIVQYRRGQSEAVQRSVEESARNNQIRAEGYYNSGILELADKKYDEALHDFNEAIKIKPDFAEAYLSRAGANVGSGQLDQSLADYNQAIQLKPDLVMAYFERADLYSMLDKNDEAIADYNRAIQIKPDYWNAYLNRGFIYENIGKFDEAIADFTQIIQSPSEEFKPDAYLRRGSAYVAKNDKERASADFQQAIALTAETGIREPASDALKSLGYKQQEPAQQSQAPAAPNIFLQYNDAKDGAVLDAIRVKLQGSGFVVKPKELSGGRTNGDVRYYHQEDKANAEKIRSIVAATLNQQNTNRAGARPNLQLIYLGNRYTYVPRGNIEIWIPPLQEPVRSIRPQQQQNYQQQLPKPVPIPKADDAPKGQRVKS